MLFLSSALLAAIGLVEKNQENRSLAAGLNSSCTVGSGCGWDNCRGDCVGSADLVCYGSSTRVCKIKSGGTCSRSSDCYGNHYCSRYNNHCRKKDKKWIGDYSVEGVSVSSMLGVSSGSTTAPKPSSVTQPTSVPRSTTLPTAIPTKIPGPITLPAGIASPGIRIVTGLVSLYSGEKQKISVVLNGVEGGGLVWTSGNQNVVRVDNLGYATAVAPGVTTIKVQSGKSVAVVPVWVREVGSLRSVIVVPTVMVTLAPAAPTLIPTLVPTRVPTAISTAIPTLVPTVIPTGVPTLVPTLIPTVIPTLVPDGELTPKISFRFSLTGIKPGSVCISSIGPLEVEVVNRSSGTYQGGLVARFKPVEGEIDSLGDQVFEVSNLFLDKSKFGGVDETNFLKIKGPFHSKNKMCQEGQSGKLSENTVCNLKLDGSKVYDFSNYALAPGDVNYDGVINSIDYSQTKKMMNESEMENAVCGIKGDFNLDGMVNSVDMGLIKMSLSQIDDE